MRLLFVVPGSWSGPPEAAESWWRAFWERLRARGHEVEVMAASAKDHADACN